MLKLTQAIGCFGLLCTAPVCAQAAPKRPASAAATTNAPAASDTKPRQAVSVTDAPYRADPTGASDATAAINAAIVATGANGRIVIPKGTYRLSGSIILPVTTFGGIQLEIESGATLYYSGRGYAIDASGANPYANVTVTGKGQVIGTEAGLGGIRYHIFNRGLIEGVRFRSFSNGDGILIEGANTITISDTETVGNRNGIHLKGSLVAGESGCACAIRIIGGHVNNNSQWGIFEDASSPSRVGNSSIVIATTFDPNGSNGPDSGNIFIQGALSTTISSYMEYSPTSWGQYQVKLGDATKHPMATVIDGSLFLSGANTAASIYDNGSNTLIMGNSEAGTPGSFIIGGPNAIGRTIGPNQTYSRTYFSGTGNGDTLQLGGAASPLLNALTATPTGIGLNSLTGRNTALSVRARNRTDPVIVNFLSASGAGVAAVNANGGVVPGNGAGTMSGGALYSGSGAPAASVGTNGSFYFRTDTPGTPLQRIYVKSAGAWVGIQ